MTHLASLPFGLPAELAYVIERREMDEHQRFQGALEMAVRYFSFDPDVLRERMPDCASLAHLLHGPLEALVLLA